MNGLKITFLMTGLMGLFLVVGYGLGGQSGMVLAFVLAAGLNFFSYWFSDKMVLKMYRAREVSETDHPRLHRVVRRLVAQAHMPLPKICIVPMRAPNAFATGRNAEHAAVAVTEGLLEMLTEDELEGVIGHELAHIQNNDMLIGTIAATFAGAVGIMASMARWGAIFGGFSRDNDRGGGIVGLLVAAIVAPMIALVIRSAISRSREFKADAGAGRLTRQYIPLATALEKLHRSPVRLNLDKRPATAHLMIANPLSAKGMARIFATHPPVAERVKRLKEMSRRVPYG